MEELFQEDFFSESLKAHHMFGANPPISEGTACIPLSRHTQDKMNLEKVWPLH